MTTLNDALKVQRRIQFSLKGTSYFVALFGSTALKGRGNDIDLFISYADDAKLTASQIAETLMNHSAKLMHYETNELSDQHTDVLMNFLTRDGHCVDVVLRGLT